MADDRAGAEMSLGTPTMQKNEELLKKKKRKKNKGKCMLKGSKNQVARGQKKKITMVFNYDLKNKISIHKPTWYTMTNK